MQVEDVYLTMSHVGLGDLNEYSLMVLFGNAHSHHLIKGLTINPSEIKAMDGTVLYPAYFMTHLKVPLNSLINCYKLWQTVSVGADVRRFGDTLLESKYILAREGNVSDNPDDWDGNSGPSMSGNNLIVAEEMNSNTAKRQVLNPNPDSIAELPRAPRSPVGIARSRILRGQNTLGGNVQFHNTTEPFIYAVANGRDTATGHAMIFAKFCEVMDQAELDFLSSRLKPGLAEGLLSHLNVLERETYYYGNCYAGEELEIYLSGNLEIPEEDDDFDELDFIPAAMLHINFEVYQKRTKTLISLAKTTKVFAVPMMEQDKIPDLLRKISQLQDNVSA